MAFFRSKENKFFFIVIAVFCVIVIIAGFVLNLVAGILTSFLCAGLCSAFFVYTLKRYKKIAQLSEQIDLVLHGREFLEIIHCDEGELSILQSEIQKMTMRLKEHSESLTNDKIYLANSMADIAHQLRTPLTSVNIIITFLNNSDLDKTNRTELCREAEVLLSRIEWLLTSLLKISKIDAGTAIFKQEPVQVFEMLTEAVKPLLIPLELRNISLQIKGDPNVRFTGDLKWSAEAFGNIIKNSIEHTDNGGKIEVSFTENTIFTEIILTDNGCGINSADLPHIFERFYQRNNNRDNNFGIGLALSRMILSSQNAVIKASNNESGGACFTVKYYHYVV